MSVSSYVLSLQQKKEKKGLGKVAWMGLCLLEKLYAWGWARRQERKKPGVRVSVPVISIGNMTAGGTGKTPTIISLAKDIQKASHKPAILTRGYKSRWEKKGGMASDGKQLRARREDVGDEPYMMARHLPGVPIYVGRNRVQSAYHAIEAGCDVLLLDDGFQYEELDRDVDIVLVDGTAPFGNGHLLPAGILREPLSALERADMVIITKGNQISLETKKEIKKKIRGVAGEIPVGEAYHRPDACISLSHWKEGKYSMGEELKGASVLLVSGIGNPHAFYRTAKESDLVPVGELVFPDHHVYTKEDMIRIKEKAKTLGIQDVVITEKDAVKMDTLPTEEDLRFYVLPITMTYEKESEKRLRQIWEALL